MPTLKIIAVNILESSEIILQSKNDFNLITLTLIYYNF